MYDGRRKTNRCLTSYRATKTHCSEKGNYWNFTLFWGIRVRESPGFFFLIRIVLGSIYLCHLDRHRFYSSHGLDPLGNSLLALIGEQMAVFSLANRNLDTW